LPQHDGDSWCCCGISISNGSGVFELLIDGLMNGSSISESETGIDESSLTFKEEEAILLLLLL
jgi:hypothetical protein